MGYASASAAVSVSLTLTAAQNTGGAGSDTLSGIERLTGSDFNDSLTGGTTANILTGGAGNDTLSGGAGKDRLLGSAGRDVLNGGLGADTLTGGAGGDFFLLTSSAASDTLTDFASGTDKIRIKMSAISVGDGDAAVEGKVSIAGPGGFAVAAELVIVTTDLGGTINAASAAAAIGSANSAYTAGAKRLFAVDNGTDSALFLFTSSGADAAVSATELTQLASLSGTAATALADYVFVA
jgi:Ca2+-binding RTX toxin-like protein